LGVHALRVGAFTTLPFGPISLRPGGGVAGVHVHPVHPLATPMDQSSSVGLCILYVKLEVSTTYNGYAVCHLVNTHTHRHIAFDRLGLYY